MSLYPYRESTQLKTYIGQFMRVFSGFQMPTTLNPDGTVAELRRIPVAYGTMDRAVAALLSKNSDHMTNVRVPFIVCNMEGIELDPTNKMPKHHIDSVVGSGAVNSFERLMGVPMSMNMSVDILASSNAELFGILEQILLIFNYRVTIQVDNKAVNANFLTEITLNSVDNQIQYPLGTEKRICSMGLRFTVPVKLRYPSGENISWIGSIREKIYASSVDAIPEIEDIIGETP